MRQCARGGARTVPCSDRAHVRRVRSPRHVGARYMAIYQYEYYRLFTSAVFHGGIMHIAMNMMSLQAMGTSLVREPGGITCIGGIER